LSRRPLLPLIRSIDGDWAKETVEKHPALRQVHEAPLDSGVVTASAISFSASPDPSDQQRALDENRMVHLSDLANTDPQAAIQSASLISDPGLRDTAFASLEPEYSKANPAAASQWGADVRKRLDSMPNTVTKLRLLVALACEGGQGRIEQSRRYASQALDFGTELFQQDLRSNPGKMGYEVNGFDTSLELAGCYGNDPSNADWMEAQVAKVGNDILRANLLIRLAKGPAMVKPREAL
jgi:hypothetical protein